MSLPIAPFPKGQGGRSGGGWGIEKGFMESKIRKTLFFTGNSNIIAI
jgi:hypothetical protein